MIKVIKYFVFLIYISMIFFNIFVFINGINLSQKIVYFDEGTKKLKKENAELEMYLYKINSLQYTASKAGELEFSKKTDPYFLDNLRFALKK